MTSLCVLGGDQWGLNEWEKRIVPPSRMFDQRDCHNFPATLFNVGQILSPSFGKKASLKHVELYYLEGCGTSKIAIRLGN